MAKTKTFKFGGLSLPVIDQADDSVPTKAHKINLKSEDAKAIALAVKHDLPTLLIGETGTGKTSAIRYLAYLRKQGYTRINMHGYNTPDELIGSKSVSNGSTYYENGVLTQAMLKGHIVVLDEINATPPDCMFIIHGLLDDDKQITLPNGDVIRPHKDFRFFATMNPDYEGTRGLNRAFMDRFNIILSVDVLSPAREVKLLQDRLSLDKDMATQMVSVAWMARKAYQEQKTLTFISTRSLLQWGKLSSEGMDNKAAYIKSIVNKARSEEQTAFTDFYNAVFKSAAEASDSDVPVIVTKGELESLKNDIQRRDDRIKEVEGQRRDLDDKLSELQSKVDNFKVDSEKIKLADKFAEENKILRHKLSSIVSSIEVNLKD